MKKSVNIILVVIFCAAYARAEFITVSPPYDSALQINVPEDKVFSLVYVGGLFQIDFNDDTFGTDKIEFGSTSLNNTNSGIVIAGPSTFYVRSRATSGLSILTYALSENSSESAGILSPSNAVVIPTDTAGSVNVILESSTDLITWTPANSGTYGSSTERRFFRVRVEVNSD